ncbi:MAG: hypothetical protein HC828_08985 [Blastochloris sp.]|nr:hypothetical protein [Blastochloris sp.]
MGLDCVGLVVFVAQDLNLEYHDVSGYSRYGDGFTLVHEMGQSLVPLTLQEIMPGDVAVFWVTRPSKPQHVAILTDIGMIHTYASTGKVVEHVLEEWWQKRMCAAFRFKNKVV